MKGKEYSLAEVREIIKTSEDYMRLINTSHPSDASKEEYEEAENLLEKIKKYPTVFNDGEIKTMELYLDSYRFVC